MAFNNFPYTDAHELNLDWILKHIKEWILNYDSILKNIDDIQNALDELNKIVAKLANGEFPENVWRQLERWFEKYAEPKIYDLITKSIKIVWFGLTDDGYFVAYIPDSWDDITFDTIMDYSSEFYGHLILEYNTTKFMKSTTNATEVF